MLLKQTLPAIICLIMYSFEVKEEAQTAELAKLVATSLRGGEVLELIGDVGAGKTTFVRYLVQALGSSDHVSSPTFTVCNQYKAGQQIIHHCDFYRLGNDDRLIEHEIAEMRKPNDILLLEWAENTRVLDKIKPVRIHISLLDDDLRLFKVENLQIEGLA